MIFDALLKTDVFISMFFLWFSGQLVYPSAFLVWWIRSSVILHWVFRYFGRHDGYARCRLFVVDVKVSSRGIATFWKYVGGKKHFLRNSDLCYGHQLHLLTEDGVVKIPPTVERQLRLVGSRLVPVIQCMLELSVDKRMKVNVNGAQTGTASLTLLARSVVRLACGWVPWLSRFVVWVASMMSLLLGGVWCSSRHPGKLWFL